MSRLPEENWLGKLHGVLGYLIEEWIREGDVLRSHVCDPSHSPRFYLPLLRFPASLLAIALAGQGLLDPEFLAWLQIESVPFDFPDDVFLQNLPLEAAERVLHGFAILQHYLSQLPPPSRPDCSGAIMGPLPASEPSRLAPACPSIPCWA